METDDKFEEVTLYEPEEESGDEERVKLRDDDEGNNEIDTVDTTELEDQTLEEVGTKMEVDVIKKDYETLVQLDHYGKKRMIDLQSDDENEDEDEEMLMNYKRSKSLIENEERLIDVDEDEENDAETVDYDDVQEEVDVYEKPDEDKEEEQEEEGLEENENNLNRSMIDEHIVDDKYENQKYNEQEKYQEVNTIDDSSEVNGPNNDENDTLELDYNYEDFDDETTNDVKTANDIEVLDDNVSNKSEDEIIEVPSSKSLSHSCINNGQQNEVLQNLQTGQNNELKYIYLLMKRLVTCLDDITQQSITLTPISNMLEEIKTFHNLFNPYYIPLCNLLDNVKTIENNGNNPLSLFKNKPNYNMLMIIKKVLQSSISSKTLSTKNIEVDDALKYINSIETNVKVLKESSSNAKKDSEEVKLLNTCNISSKTIMIDDSDELPYTNTLNNVEILSKQLGSYDISLSKLILIGHKIDRCECNPLALSKLISNLNTIMVIKQHLKRMSSGVVNLDLLSYVKIAMECIKSIENQIEILKDGSVESCVLHGLDVNSIAKDKLGYSDAQINLFLTNELVETGKEDVSVLELQKLTKKVSEISIIMSTLSNVGNKFGTNLKYTSNDIENSDYSSIDFEINSNVSLDEYIEEDTSKDINKKFKQGNKIKEKLQQSPQSETSVIINKSKNRNGKRKQRTGISNIVNAQNKINQISIIDDDSLTTSNANSYSKNVIKSKLDKNKSKLNRNIYNSKNQDVIFGNLGIIPQNWNCVPGIVKQISPTDNQHNIKDDSRPIVIPKLIDHSVGKVKRYVQPLLNIPHSSKVNTHSGQLYKKATNVPEYSVLSNQYKTSPAEVATFPDSGSSSRQTVNSSVNIPALNLSNQYNTPLMGVQSIPGDISSSGQVFKRPNDVSVAEQWKTTKKSLARHLSRKHLKYKAKLRRQIQQGTAPPNYMPVVSQLMLQHNPNSWASLLKEPTSLLGYPQQLTQYKPTAPNMQEVFPPSSTGANEAFKRSANIPGFNLLSNQYKSALADKQTFHGTPPNSEEKLKNKSVNIHGFGFPSEQYKSMNARPTNINPRVNSFKETIRPNNAKIMHSQLSLSQPNILPTLKSNLGHFSIINSSSTLAHPSNYYANKTSHNNTNRLKCNVPSTSFSRDDFVYNNPSTSVNVPKPKYVPERPINPKTFSPWGPMSKIPSTFDNVSKPRKVPERPINPKTLSPWDPISKFSSALNFEHGPSIHTAHPISTDIPETPQIIANRINENWKKNLNKPRELGNVLYINKPKSLLNPQYNYKQKSPMDMSNYLLQNHFNK